jgi:hypothetical protein
LNGFTKEKESIMEDFQAQLKKKDVDIDAHFKAREILDKLLQEVFSQALGKHHMIEAKQRICDEIIEKMCNFIQHFEMFHHCETILIAIAQIDSNKLLPDVSAKAEETIQFI